MRLLIVFVVFLLTSFELLAEQRISHLYEARVPLVDTSAAAQQEAIAMGLQTVLNKISGYSGTASFSELQNEIDQASSMLSEFAIQSIDLPAADGLGVESGNALYMRFVTSGIDRIVRQFEIPVWPATRPEILVLVVTEFAGQPYLLTEETHPAAFALMQQIAFDRGISFVFLNQEDFDFYQASAEAIWNLDEIALQVTFALLASDSVAVIRLGTDTEFSSGTKISGDLSVIGAEENYSLPLKGSNISEMLTGGWNSYLDDLSLTTAFVASGTMDSRVLIEIDNTSSFSDFLRVRDYIVQLEQVESAKLLRVDANTLVFQLQFQSGLELLRTSLTNSGFLTDKNPGQLSIGTADQLSYSYRPPISIPNARDESPDNNSFISLP